MLTNQEKSLSFACGMMCGLVSMGAWYGFGSYGIYRGAIPTPVGYLLYLTGLLIAGVVAKDVYKNVKFKLDNPTSPAENLSPSMNV